VKQKWDQSGLDMTNLLAVTAKDPALTLAFNYASALINNSYFLEGIVRPPYRAVTKH
jgi:Fe-Mn family superoxide dismutase